MLLKTGALGIFSLPLYYMGILPYNQGGAIPQLWSNGHIANWGWMAPALM